MTSPKRHLSPATGPPPRSSRPIGAKLAVRARSTSPGIEPVRNALSRSPGSIALAAASCKRDSSDIAPTGGASGTDSARLQRVRLPIDISRNRLARDYRKQFATDRPDTQTNQRATTHRKQQRRSYSARQPRFAISSPRQLFRHRSPSHTIRKSAVASPDRQSISQPSRPFGATISHVLSHTISLGRSKPQSARAILPRQQ